MPKYARRKFNRKRRSTAWYNKKYSVSQIARKAWNTAKYVKGLINVEKKFFDVNQSGLISGATGTCYPLSQISQGDAYNNRDGNTVRAKSLLIRNEYAMSASSEYDFIRVLIFTDNQNSGTTPTVLDVLETANSNSPLNHLNGSRFTIHRDFKLALKKDLNATQTKTYINLNQHLKYSSGTATDTREGNLYILFQPSDGTNPSSYSYNSRLRFIDN